MLGQRGNCNRQSAGIAKAIADFASYVPIFCAGSSGAGASARLAHFASRRLDAADAGDNIAAQD
jgi:hypothetical protein